MKNDEIMCKKLINILCIILFDFLNKILAFVLVMLYNNYRNKENNTNTEKEKVIKMKNMTLKEFKENLKDTNFESFTLQDILNCLSILCDYLSKDSKQKELNVASDADKKSADIIYKRLKELGYYK